jgi:hypothetical protein
MFDRHCEFVIRRCRTTALGGPTNPHQKEVAMKKPAITSVALFAALVVGSAANAASYDYTAHYTHVGRPALADAQIDAQLQADTATCDSVVGVQRVAPSASYRSCMQAHGWKYNFVTRVRAAPAPADPYFSSNAKVAPGHFIDHDNGMDCQNMGGAEVCDPPNGTVHYFDPDQDLPCTRTGAMSVCSNL